MRIEIKRRTNLALALLLGSIPGLAFASDEACRIAYLHADKTSEERACEAAANVRNADAELQYGLILWSGDRPVHDRRAALEWIRKSARQGDYVAQISLGGLLNHKDVEPELRNPVEAFAWLVTAGDQQGAQRLRATFNQADAATADRLASDYKTKYALLQASRAGWCTRATDGLSKIWPGLLVLGCFIAARRRLARRLLFVVAGIVIAYASQFLALWALTVAMNAMMMRFPSQLLNAVVWTFGVAFLLSVFVPTIAVWARSRFWMRERRVQTT